MSAFEEALPWHTRRQETTVYPKKYAHGFVVLCFVVVMQSFIINSHEVCIHIHQGCFAGTGAIVRLPQCQWSKPDGYGTISQCITTTKHSKAKTVCIFLGIYCMNATQGNQGIYCFLHVSTCAPTNLPTVFNFPGKPLKPISSNHTWLTYGCRTQFGTHLVQGHQAIEAGQNLTYPDDQIKTAYQSLQNFLDIPHLPCFQSDYILDEFCPKLLSTFVVKLQIRFPQSNILFAIGMVGPIDVKQLDGSTARRQLKSPQSLSGRSIHLTLVTKWSWSWSWMTHCHLLCAMPIGPPILRYSYFKIWPWKSMVKVMCVVKAQGHI